MIMLSGYAGTCKLLFCCSIIDYDSFYVVARERYFQDLSISSYMFVYLRI